MVRLTSSMIGSALTLSVLLHGAVLAINNFTPAAKQLELLEPLSLQVALTAPPTPAPPKPMEQPAPVAPVPAKVVKKVIPKKAVAPAPPVAQTVPVAATAAPTTAVSKQVSAVSPSQVKEMRLTYEQELLRWLEAHKRYPMSARRRGVEGSGSVYVKIDRTGSVKDFSLVQSTGSSLLDDALLQMVSRADPFPQVPRDLKGSTFEFVVPVSFKLRSR